MRFRIHVGYFYAAIQDTSGLLAHGHYVSSVLCVDVDVDTVAHALHMVPAV